MENEIYFSLTKEKEKCITNIIEKGLVKNKDEVVLMCLGTPKLDCDSFAPMFGQKVKEKCLNIICYGDMDSPETAKTAKNTYELIKEKHKNALVISIGSMVSGRNDMNKGELYLGSKRFLVAAGFNRGNPEKTYEVGDIKIVYKVGVSKTDAMLYSNEIYNTNKSINILINFIEELIDNINELKE